jgi:outer membrane lipoprotein-sorting protein
LKKRLMPCLTAGVVFSAVEQETTSLSTSSPVDKDLLELFKKAGEIDQLYYEVKTSVGREELYKGKTWMKGSMVRNEIDFNGDIIVFIYDIETGVGYSYNPAEKTGMRTEFASGVTEGQRGPTSYTEEVASCNYRVEGTETRDGHKCKVVVLLDDQGAEESRLWISEQYGIPVRVEGTTEEGFLVLEYKNLNTGPISDDVFKVPEDVEIFDTR